MTAVPRRSLHLAPGHVALDTRVFHKEARSLADAGWAVTVVAQHPGSERVDGIDIVGLPRPRHRLVRFVLGPVRLLLIALRHRAEVVHLHDAEAVPVGVVLSLLGRTVVLDSHEDYPRLVLDRPWIPRPLRRPVAAVVRAGEAVAARVVRAVISAEDVGAQRFPAAKTTVVRNHVLVREFGAAPAVQRGGLVYVGDITAARGAREMVEVAGRVHRTHGARLCLVGRLSPAALEQELAALEGWAAVDHLGWQDRAGVQRALAGAAVGLVLWQPTRKHAEGAVPVKLLEYLAAGVPVVASDFPAIRAVVEPARCGVLVDPTDVAAVAEAVAGLLDDPAEAAAMGARGAAAVRAHHSWDTEAARLVALYDSLVPA